MTPKSKAKKKGDALEKSPKASKDKEEKKDKKEEAKASPKPAKDAAKKPAAKKKKKGGNAPLRMAKKEILYRNSPGLSQLQTEYESKLWPKHFLEDVANSRIDRFTLLEEKKEQKKLAEAKKAEAK